MSHTESENIMSSRIARTVKQQIRRYFFNNNVVNILNIGLIGPIIAHFVPALSPSILIISIPRSGSSWVGDVLGLSPTSLYLREPITQTYVSGRIHPTFFELPQNEVPRNYKQSAVAAFSARPSFPYSIVKYPSQWSFSERSNRRPVIKEVNPLALKWFMDSFSPRIIYLIRHPAAIVNSFVYLGWTRKPFEKRISAHTLNSRGINYERFSYSFWAEHGALQSVIIRLSLEILQEYQDSKIVKYEEICANPVDVFRDLYEFSELEWSSAVEEQVIARSTINDAHTTGNTGIHRFSQSMIDRWKTEVSEEHLEEVKEGYLFFDPPYYGVDEW